MLAGKLLWCIAEHCRYHAADINKAAIVVEFIQEVAHGLNKSEVALKSAVELPLELAFFKGLLNREEQLSDKTR